jgi:Tfp pilus assembly protein PilN
MAETADVGQQINLYQPILSQERKPFSAALVGAVLGIVLVALAGFSIHAKSQVGRLEHDLDLLRAQQADQEAQLAQVGALQANGLSVAALEAHVKELSATVAERSSALQILRSGAAGQTSGFAPRLEALARRHVEGLWIDTLLMSGTTGSMTLSGATVDPDIVPAYLRSLSGEPVLAGTRFDDFVIEREDASKKQIRFHAGSKSLVPTRKEEPT